MDMDYDEGRHGEPTARVDTVAFVWSFARRYDCGNRLAGDDDIDGVPPRRPGAGNDQGRLHFFRHV
jgi:hypothetical protein